MQELPHHYRTSASAEAEGAVSVSSPGLQTLATAAPAEFGGPGDLWSPETLFAASIADCFILSFRAIAKASRVSWTRLECDVEAVLERADGKMRFTRVNVVARLTIPAETDERRAHRLMEKAEQNCLITNSLTAGIQLDATVSR